MRCITLIVLWAGSLPGQLTITEVMYDLPGSDSPNEFVEVFNRSAADSISLQHWELRDRYATDQLVEAGRGWILPPGGYAVIFEGDYDFLEGLYRDLLPDSVLTLRVDDLSIGNGLSGSDSLYLLDSSGVVRDSLGWSDRAPDGYSLEKIRPWLPNIPANWSSSRDSLGTPGRINSVFPPPIDGQLLSDSLRLAADSLYPGETTGLRVVLTNAGLDPFNAEVLLIRDKSFLYESPPFRLEALDTLGMDLNLPALPSGRQVLEVLLLVPGDADTSSNRGRVTLGIRFAPRVLTLNEFLAQPEAGQEEFVELVNRTEGEIGLAGWILTDSHPGEAYRLPALDVGPGEYLVVSRDSTLFPITPSGAHYVVPGGGFPALNNGGDALRLFDPFGTRIDSLVYSSAWGIRPGLALEKLQLDFESGDSAHWRASTAPAGCTPGALNSVTLLEVNGSLVEAAVRSSPPHPRAGEALRLEAAVVNSGLTSFSAQLSVERQDQELASGPVPSLSYAETSRVVLDLPPLPWGPQELTLRLFVDGDRDPRDNTCLHTVGVRYPAGLLELNEFLAHPGDGQQEFVELYYHGDRILDTQGWLLADDRTTSLAAWPALKLNPGAYLVATSDSALLPVLPAGTPLLVPEGGFPTLNNGGDLLRLYDPYGTRIDSLGYGADWPLAPGRSTEKILPGSESHLPGNWRLSRSPSGSSPGRVNSVTPLLIDGALVPGMTGFAPPHPEAGQPCEATFPVVNAGTAAFQGELSVWLAGTRLATSGVPAPAYTETTRVTLALPGLSAGPQVLELELTIPGDQDPSNNHIKDTLQVRYPFGGVTLNEFLARPDSTQAEFVELWAGLPLNLQDWQLGDGSGSWRSLPDCPLSSGELVVLAADSLLPAAIPAVVLVIQSWPGLHNTADAIRLRDPTGKLIDSLRYDQDWPLQPGRSTEKLRPEYPSDDYRRWAVAVNREGATPGRPNSMLVYNPSRRVGIVLSPNPFSPDGDGFEDRLQIHYHLPYDQALLTLEIFDILGRRIATPLWNTAVAGEGLAEWDGRRSDGQRSRMGLYILKTSARNPQNGKTWEDVQTLVVARLLH